MIKKYKILKLKKFLLFKLFINIFLLSIILYFLFDGGDGGNSATKSSILDYLYNLYYTKNPNYFTNIEDIYTTENRVAFSRINEIKKLKWGFTCYISI